MSDDQTTNDPLYVLPYAGQTVTTEIPTGPDDPLLLSLGWDGTPASIGRVLDLLRRRVGAREREIYGWRPIATAPTDRGAIELRGPSCAPVFGYFDDDRHAKQPRPYWSTDAERLWGTRHVRANQPTEWRPQSDACAPGDR